MRNPLIAIVCGVVVAGAAVGWVVANRSGVGAGSVVSATTATAATATAVTPVVFRYEVTGMHCGGCAEAITAELMELPGVQKVDCQYETHHAEIVVADASLQPKVEHAITKLGYTIAPSSK